MTSIYRPASQDSGFFIHSLTNIIDHFATKYDNHLIMGEFNMEPNNPMFNPLSAKFIKWSNTLKQIVGKLPTICLSVFDHFSGLAFKGLRVF